MNKKANAIATILMLAVIISTMGIYFSTNSITKTSTDLNKIKITDSEYQLMIEGIVYYSIDQYLKNGFSQDNSYVWFENGPYPPNRNNFLQDFNNTLQNYISQYLNTFTLYSNEEFVISEMNIDYNYRPTENIFTLTIKNLSVELDEEKYYLKRSYNDLSFDLSSFILIYNKFYDWNNNEGVEMFNQIVAPLNSVAAATCYGCRISSLDVISSVDDLSTGLDRNNILSTISIYVNKLNTVYFKDTQISCEYKITHENIFEYNYTIQNRINSLGSECTTSDIPLSGDNEVYIWREEGNTVISDSTISYSVVPRFNYIGTERSLSVPEENLDINTSLIKNVVFEDSSINNDESTEQIIAGSYKKSPFVAFSLDIFCKDKDKTYFDGSKIKSLEARFGYRMNIFKDMDGYTDISDLTITADCSGPPCFYSINCNATCQVLQEKEVSPLVGNCGDDSCQGSDKPYTQRFQACNQETGELIPDDFRLGAKECLGDSECTGITVDKFDFWCEGDIAKGYGESSINFDEDNEYSDSRDDNIIDKHKREWIHIVDKNELTQSVFITDNTTYDCKQNMEYLIDSEIDTRYKNLPYKPSSIELMYCHENHDNNGNHCADWKIVCDPDDFGLKTVKYFYSYAEDIYGDSQMYSEYYHDNMILDVEDYIGTDICKSIDPRYELCGYYYNQPVDPSYPISHYMGVILGTEETFRKACRNLNNLKNVNQGEWWGKYKRYDDYKDPEDSYWADKLPSDSPEDSPCKYLVFCDGGTPERLYTNCRVYRGHKNLDCIYPGPIDVIPPAPCNQASDVLARCNPSNVCEKGILYGENNGAESCSYQLGDWEPLNQECTFNEAEALGCPKPIDAELN